MLFGGTLFKKLYELPFKKIIIVKVCANKQYINND